MKRGPRLPKYLARRYAQLWFKPGQFPRQFVAAGALPQAGQPSQWMAGAPPHVSESAPRQVAAAAVVAVDAFVEPKRSFGRRALARALLRAGTFVGSSSGAQRFVQRSCRALATRRI